MVVVTMIGGGDVVDGDDTSMAMFRLILAQMIVMMLMWLRLITMLLMTLLMMWMMTTMLMFLMMMMPMQTLMLVSDDAADLCGRRCCLC